MAKDRYKYFRIETREILDGLSNGVMELERGGTDGARLDNLFRLAHTLKGAARVVEQDGIADAAHAIEDLLARYRDGADAACADEILHQLDAIALDLASLGVEGAARAPARDSEREEPVRTSDFEAVRVHLSAFDALLASLSEAGAQLDAMKRESGVLVDALRLASDLAISHPDVQGVFELKAALGKLQHALGDRLDRAERDFGESRELANELRLVPASAIFPELQRAVRDTGSRLGKRVAFRTTGGEQRLDSHVLGGIRDALLHLISNGIDHGLEPEHERLARGKAPEGLIELSVFRKGSRVAFRLRDDGRGVDIGAVQQAAAQRAMLDPHEATTLEIASAIRLIFRPGFSTAGQVSAVSGRGIGLDAVNSLVSKFKGELHFDTKRGEGTTLELVVPVSLASIRALLVALETFAVAVPMDAVVRTLRLPAGEVTSHGGTETILLDGEVIPFMPLWEVFAENEPAAATEVWSVVIVRFEDRLAAIGVNRLVGMADLLVRPLPALVGTLPLVIGTAFDADGTPQPVLDPQGLVAAARARTRAEHPAQAAPALPILVIDDSLTTRMLEQSILESAGFTVALATHAEEGLVMARQRRYGLFIVDVEMPGMSGFEFIAATRDDARLADTPAILVTSRATAEDRRRGLEVGARAYIVKGEFDQGVFLQTVRGLVG